MDLESRLRFGNDGVPISNLLVLSASVVAGLNGIQMHRGTILTKGVGEGLPGYRRRYIGFLLIGKYGGWMVLNSDYKRGK